MFTSVSAIALMQHGPTIDGRKTLALMCKLLINITYSATVAQEQIAGTYFQCIEEIFQAKLRALALHLINLS